MHAMIIGACMQLSHLHVINFQSKKAENSSGLNYNNFVEWSLNFQLIPNKINRQIKQNSHTRNPDVMFCIHSPNFQVSILVDKTGESKTAFSSQNVYSFMHVELMTEMSKTLICSHCTFM